MTAHRFIQPAADTIAFDGGFTDFFAYHHSQAVLRAATVLAVFQGHERSSHGLAMLVNVAQRAMSMEAVGATNHTDKYQVSSIK